MIVIDGFELQDDFGRLTGTGSGDQRSIITVFIVIVRRRDVRLIQLLLNAIVSVQLVQASF
jgi:hypothetical protein